MAAQVGPQYPASGWNPQPWQTSAQGPGGATLQGTNPQTMTTPYDPNQSVPGQAYQNQATQNQAQLDANLSNQAFQQRFGTVMGAIPGLMSSAAGTISGYGTGATGAGGAIPYTGYSSDALNAARAAAFARAKDTQGQVARSAVNELQNLYTGSGQAGSGQLMARQGQAVLDAASGMGEFNRQQALADLAAQQGVSQAVYEGGITQRGQDIAAQTAARGQNLGVINAMLGLANVGKLY